MTSGTEFKTWRTEFVERFQIEQNALHYEITDPKGDRRLNEVIKSADNNRKNNSTQHKEGKGKLFTFDASTPDIKRRHRFDSPNEVQIWYKLSFDITHIHGSDDIGDNYTFEVGFLKSDELNELAISEENTSRLVVVDQEQFESGYQPIRAFRVAGLSEQRDLIRDFIQSDGSRWGLEPEHGMLLEGPPGTGKTELVMEICREEFGAVPVEISGPEILSRWLGESERILRERFEQARSNPSKVLYIDEIDAIARSRGKSTQEYSAQIVAQLLVLLDGLDTKRGESPVKVIASTNMAKLIDDALRRPGRLGRTITFDPLSGKDTLAVLHHYLEEIYRNQRRSGSTSDGSTAGKLSSDLEAFVTDANVEQLQPPDSNRDIDQFLSGLTGAEIEQIVQRGTRYADEDSESDSDTIFKPRHLFKSQYLENNKGEIMLGKNANTGESKFASSSVLRIPPKQGQEEIKREFQKFLRDHDEYEEGVFRTFILNEDLFYISEDAIWSQVWKRFRTNRKCPVCVYVPQYDRIARVADYSPVAQKIIEAICERLAAEPNENSPPILFGYKSESNSSSPRIEEFSSDYTD